MMTRETFYSMYREENPWIHEYHSPTTPSMNATTPTGVVIDRYIEGASFLRCSDITLGLYIAQEDSGEDTLHQHQRVCLGEERILHHRLFGLRPRGGTASHSTEPARAST